MKNSSVHLFSVPASPVAAAIGQRQGAIQNLVLSYCCYAGLFLFPLISSLCPSLHHIGSKWKLVLSGSSWTLNVTFEVDSFTSKCTSLIEPRINVSSWCYVPLSRPPYIPISLNPTCASETQATQSARVAG